MCVTRPILTFDIIKGEVKIGDMFIVSNAVGDFVYHSANYLFTVISDGVALCNTFINWVFVDEPDWYSDDEPDWSFDDEESDEEGDEPDWYDADDESTIERDVNAQIQGFYDRLGFFDDYDYEAYGY